LAKLLHGLVARGRRIPSRIGVRADQFLSPGERAGVNGILHEATCEIELACVNSERHHATDGNHPECDEHQNLPSPASPNILQHR